MAKIEFMLYNTIMLTLTDNKQTIIDSNSRSRRTLLTLTIRLCILWEKALATSLTLDFPAQVRISGTPDRQ